MSSRPPSPRSLRARGRASALRASSGFTGNAAGHDNDDDELMTINENRNVVGGGTGGGIAGSSSTSSADSNESAHANSSISSSASSTSSSSASSTAGSDGAPSDPSSLLLGEGTGMHPMHASSSCNACCSLMADGNHAFPHEHERPLVNGCEDMWSWNKRDRSKEVWLSRSDNRRVYFHPNWSKGTAGIRGTRVLNNGRYYWEISLTQRVFGTSMMFGIGTKKARLHVNMFTNLLGEDRNGWGLSHKGLLWHGGVARNYTKRFKENQPTKIGLLFDGIAGTLTYYKDDICLGVAFRGLNEVREPLYPIVCSTAAKTEMLLSETRRDFVNLQDRCRAIIIKHVNTREKLDRLALPYFIKNYLSEAVTESNASVTPLELHLIDQYLY
uniref:SPRY domain-containing SOCS box protein 3 n=1 Tax=Anopheles atroparvus TaxID=41427 RepID=A0A182JCG0_ANOAO